MSREKNLMKNILVLGMGKMLPQLTVFITLPILTAKLTKAEYGTYDLISTLILLVIPITTLQIQSAAFRFLIDCRENREKSRDIITNIFIVTIPLTAVVSFFIYFLFNDLSGMAKVMISGYFFIDTFYQTCGQIVRGLGKNKEYSMASIIVSTVNMCCVLLLVGVKGKGLLGVFISLVCANVIGSIYLLLKAKIQKYVSFAHISLKQIRELISYSWPMIPNNLSTWVIKLSDRLVITAFLGVEANAIYAVANKVPNILSMAQSIMVMAWQENASVAVKDKDATEYYSRMLESAFNLMHGLTVLLIAATPFIFKILVWGDYDEAYYQMPVLIFAMFFFVMSSYFGGIYIAHKKTTNVGISTVVAAIVNLTIDLMLVKIIGIWAGSVSTLVAYVILYFYRLFNVQKFQTVRYNLKKQFLQIISIFIMLILCFQRQKILDVVNVFLGGILFVLYNRELVINILGNFKKRNFADWKGNKKEE